MRENLPWIVSSTEYVHVKCIGTFWPAQKRLIFHSGS